MLNYVLTEKALEDLSGIWGYSFDSWSEAQADKYYFMITDSCQELGTQKVKGKPYTEIYPELFGYRIGEHIILYRYTSDTSIEVIRILHSRMDLKYRLSE